MQSYDGYSVVWVKIALKLFKKLDKNVQQKIVAKIDLLLIDLASLDIKQLEGYYQAYRIKVGSYRIVFKVVKDSKKIIICLVAHRQSVYQLLKHFNMANLA